MNQKTTRIMRLIARIWAGVMLAFMLFMFIAHIIEDGIGPALDFSPRDSLMMVSMVLSVLGLALAWKWERPGGILTLASMAAFYIINFAFDGNFPRGPVFLIIALPGVLFILSSLESQEEVTEET